MTEPCPGCGQLDQVQQVPAAYRGGSPGVGDASFAALDPYPPPHRSGGLLAAVIVLVVAGSGLLLLPFSVLGGPGAGTKAMDVLVVSLPALCGYVAAGVLAWRYARRVREFRRQRRGVPAARQVWEQGWFCHRCGGVYFADAGRLLTTAHFRQLVARAGGYAR